MRRIRSYSYPIDSLTDEQLLALRNVVYGGLSAQVTVTLEAETFPGALAAAGELGRLVQAAGLPPLYFRGSSDGCPSCGAAVDVEQTGADDGQEQLEL